MFENLLKNIFVGVVGEVINKNVTPIQYEVAKETVEKIKELTTQ